MQNGMPEMMNVLISKPTVKLQYGERPFLEAGISNNSDVD